MNSCLGRQVGPGRLRIRDPRLDRGAGHMAAQRWPRALHFAKVEIGRQHRKG